MGCSSSSTAEGEERKLFKDAEILRKKREEDVRGFLKSALLKNAYFNAQLDLLEVSDAEIDKLVDLVIFGPAPEIVNTINTAIESQVKEQPQRKKPSKYDNKKEVAKFKLHSPGNSIFFREKKLVFSKEGDEGDDVIYIVHRGSVREIHGPYQGSVLRAGELYGVDNFIAAVNNLPKPTRELDRTLAAAGSKALDTYLITQEPTFVYLLTKEMYHAAFDKDLPLGRMKLFKDLPAELIEEIGSCGEVLTFQKGDDIVKQGEEASGVYVILRGHVKTACAFADSCPVVTNESPILAPGDIFGDYASVLNEREPQTITALGDVRIRRFSADDCLSPAFVKGEIAQKLDQQLAKRFDRERRRQSFQQQEQSLEQQQQQQQLPSRRGSSNVDQQKEKPLRRASSSAVSLKKRMSRRSSFTEEGLKSWEKIDDVAGDEDEDYGIVPTANSNNKKGEKRNSASSSFFGDILGITATSAGGDQ